MAARDESGGLIAAVGDEQILAAHRLLSAHEAVFVEPASAAEVAGLLVVAQADGVTAEQLRGHSVVCTVTGNGLKDPEWAVRSAPPPIAIAADVQLAAKALKLY